MKHENVVLFDNAGLPSVMVKFTPEAGKPLDPVFMVCGRRAKKAALPCAERRQQKPAGSRKFEAAGRESGSAGLMLASAYERLPRTLYRNEVWQEQDHGSAGRMVGRTGSAGVLCGGLLRRRGSGTADFKLSALSGLSEDKQGSTVGKSESLQSKGRRRCGK